jgi:hypothetical protein
MNPYWTTASGEKIPYEQLSDEHLKNIIKDGYRNPNIFNEAKHRGFRVPTRKVDKLKIVELFTWVEAFASSALSGCEYASKMIDLWDNNKPAFYFHLNRFLERQK